MHGLAKVAPLLLVPPISVRVPVLALDEGRVDVTAVLPQKSQPITLLLLAIRSPQIRRVDMITHHARVLRLSQLRMVGVLGLDRLRVVNAVGEEGASLLDGG